MYNGYYLLHQVLDGLRYSTKNIYIRTNSICIQTDPPNNVDLLWCSFNV